MQDIFTVLIQPEAKELSTDLLVNMKNTNKAPNIHPGTYLCSFIGACAVLQQDLTRTSIFRVCSGMEQCYFLFTNDQKLRDDQKRLEMYFIIRSEFVSFLKIIFIQ